MKIKVGDTVITNLGYKRTIDIVEQEGKDYIPQPGNIVLTLNNEVICYLSAHKYQQLGIIKERK